MPCRQCLCDECLPINLEFVRKERRLQEQRDARDAREAQRLENQSHARELRLREGAMIWLLMNAGVAQERVAGELTQRWGYVTHRRQEYTRELERRSQVLARTAYGFVQRLRRTGALGSHTDDALWAGPPGSVGSDLPTECSKCGGMMTEGRDCMRKICRKATRRR